MAQRFGNTYKCLFCDFTHNNPSIVNDHQQNNHDFVLLPVTRDELNKLMLFIFSTTNEDNRKLINQDLYLRIQRYAKYRVDAPSSTD